MTSPSELTLNCKPQDQSMFLNSLTDHPDTHIQKLEEYLSRLEEECLRIDAFKRELPLCMQLLTNAMEISRRQLQSYQANQGGRPVLEFIPLKNSSTQGSDQKPAGTTSEKASWMTSAQLWSQENEGIKNQARPKGADIGFSVSPKLGLDTKQRNGGAFLPFTKEQNSGPEKTRTLPDLALASGDPCEVEYKKHLEVKNEINGLRRENSIKEGNAVGASPTDIQTSTVTTTDTTGGATATTQAHRKARRCWSPDLHRRFVNALQMLGGSQVATPKQIRELMKVDDLTNDEVKSHLQKYRLHTRRPSSSLQAAGAPATQLVVIGGIWVAPEYAAAATAHGGARTIYGAHQASQVPQHYCLPPTKPQNLYNTTSAPSQQHPHLTIHQMYNTTSQTRSSHESSDRKNMAIVRDGKEEGNGSEIALKF